MMLRFVISQNVDGLHVRSGFPRDRLAELHGNMFVERCERCGWEEVREEPLASMGLRPTGRTCSDVTGTRCRGRMRDSVLDWEHDLPQDHLDNAIAQSKAADLNLCLGTSLQIQPANKLPLHVLRNGGSLVVVNLQETKLHRKASIVINARVDDVMRLLCRKLDVSVPSDTTVSILHHSRHGPPLLLNQPTSSSPKTGTRKRKTPSTDTCSMSNQSAIHTPPSISSESEPQINNHLEQNYKSEPIVSVSASGYFRSPLSLIEICKSAIKSSNVKSDF